MSRLGDRVRAWLCAAFVTDRTVAALRQTAMDWRFEVSVRPSVMHRVVCFVRWHLAMARVFALTALDEARAPVAAMWGLRFAGWVFFLTWMNFSPANWPRSSATELAMENSARIVLAAAIAIAWAPLLTLMTAPRKGEAPIALLYAVTVLGIPTIGTLVLPVATQWHYSSWPWLLNFTVVVSAVIATAIGERVRTDRRRLLVTAAVVALPAFVFLNSQKLRIVLFLDDLGLLPSDVVYLPSVPAASLRLAGPWTVLLVELFLFAWLVRRRLRTAAFEATA